MKVSCGPNTVPVLIWTLAASLVLWSEVSATDTTNTKNCILLSESVSQRNSLSRLEPLTQRNFTADKKVGEKSYTYVFQLCGDAGGGEHAGVIQTENAGKTVVVGRYNSTRVIGGSDWVMLNYSNGEVYDNHCSNEKRRAIVMFSCDRKSDKGQLTMIKEDNNHDVDCYYLFELRSSVLCSVVQSHISTGTIIIIIGICLLAVYLIGGFLYQRLVVGAKGMEQFPNYAFWVEFGNLTAVQSCSFQVF